MFARRWYFVNPGRAHRTTLVAATRHDSTEKDKLKLASYSVVLIWDEAARAWSAEVPAFDGIATCGSTVEEALEMAREMIELHIEHRQERGEPLPVEEVPVQVHRVDVTTELSQ